MKIVFMILQDLDCNRFCINSIVTKKSQQHTTLWQGCLKVATPNNQYTTLQQCNNYTEAPKLPQHWVLGLTHNILWMLYWQRCFNFKITKSNSRCLHNIDFTESWEAEKAFIINLFFLFKVNNKKNRAAWD